MAVIALAGGGTGGHVYPALAMGDALKQRGHTVLYYGDPTRLEARVAPDRGYAFRPVVAPQYPRGGISGKVGFAWGLFKAIWASRSQLKADNVDVVLGVGGYIAAPTVLAAWTLGLGRVIHEANAVPGLANKLCARVAQQVLLTYPTTRLPGGAPTHVVGVPVNPAILQGNNAQAATRYNLDPNRPVVLFVGGSLGAARINELAVAVAQHPARSFQVLHLCGPRYHQDIQRALTPLPPDVWLVDYEDRMGLAYGIANLVVCRAGSATLGELTAVGRASVLIPSPNVTDNHQEANARALQEAGAAQVLVEADWNVAHAVSQVFDLATNTKQLDAMAAAAQSQANVQSAERAADVVEGLLG